MKRTPIDRRDFLRTTAAVAAGISLPPLISSQALGGAVPPGSLKFVAHRIGHFRSEACCVGDFNNDGKLDIVAGPYLYLAPDWKPQKIREIRGKVNDKGLGYYDDFMNIAMDVDGDGLLDVVAGAWFAKRTTWYRNPGKAGGLWEEKVVDNNGNNECGDPWDLLGTGKCDVIIPSLERTIWYERGIGPDGKRGLVRHVVSEKRMPFGVGVGDINGDGRPDIIRPNAWFEAPADPRNGRWIEHPLSLGGKDGKIEHTPQIWVYDVNGDGLPDIITSSAHGYGIFWYEQVRKGGEISWKQHVIDDTWTQAHAIVLADLDNDGVPELITGKRFMAHNGDDPEENAPLGVYYYKLTRGPNPVWTKHVISYDEGIGAGLNIVVADINGDGRLDIVVTGKWGGPVWFENRGIQGQ
jgi:hypothetical protein